MKLHIKSGIHVIQSEFIYRNFYKIFLTLRKFIATQNCHSVPTLTSVFHTKKASLSSSGKLLLKSLAPKKDETR
jgi:hypothetical protein